MSDLLRAIDSTHAAILKNGEKPRDVLIPAHLQPMLKQAFGLQYHPAPIEWETYRGMNIEWTSFGAQLSIRTTGGDVRICK